MWQTSFFIKKMDTDQIENMLKVCRDINKRDPSFRFKIVGENLNIYSKEKDQAFRRGSWLINNSPPFKELGYNVYFMR